MEWTLKFYRFSDNNDENKGKHKQGEMGAYIIFEKPKKLAITILDIFKISEEKNRFIDK